MSIYDREYMRGARGGFSGGRAGSSPLSRLAEASAVKVLIIANVCCYVAGLFFDGLFGYGAFFGLFELSSSAIASGRVWTLLTYSFLHADFLHIFLNMLGLYFIGSPLERIVGKGRFYAAYFAGALLGGALWLALSWNAREGLVGASAAVMSVFSCFCALYPPVPLTFLLFFVIPLSLKPMTMLKIAVALELVGLVSSFSGHSAIAYSAHLGGIGAGLLAARFFRSGASRGWTGFRKPKFDFFRKSVPPRLPGEKSASDYKFSVNIGGRPSDSDRVDEILDKINSGGFASLTDEEREFLKKAREGMK